MSPLGRSAELTWKSLLAGESHRGVGRIDCIPPDPELPRVEQLALLCVEQLLASRAVGGQESDFHDAALIVGTSKGTVDAWLDRISCGRPDALEHELLADVTTRVACHFDLRGPRLTVSAACASGLLALIRGVLMIRAGEAHRVLVLGVESSLHELFAASFQRLGVLAPDGVCRPFDRNRHGFFLSEAAAAVLLKRCDSMPRRGGDDAPLEIESFALGADATHLTASDPSGRGLEALLRRVLPGGGVDLIQAHGTGTEANDQAELRAIDNASAGNSPPWVYSHKGAIGHTLGASGLVAVTLNCLAHRFGVIPGNANLLDPLSAQHVHLPRQQVRTSVRRSVALAAGFGGPLAAVCLRSG